MDWTIGPLDYFFGPFFRPFFFFALFFGPFYRGEADHLYLGEGWDVIYQYSGRGGRQDILLLRKEGEWLLF